MQAAIDEAKTRYNSQLSAARKTQEEEHLKAMSVLNPLEDEQNDINRQLEMIAAQIQFIDEVLSTQSNDLDERKSRYQRMIKDQKEIYISSYVERLKSRSYIYYKGDIVELTQGIRDSLSQTFLDKLNTEIQEHASIDWLNKSSDLLSARKRLDEKRRLRTEQATYLLDERTRKGQAWLDFEEKLGKKQYDLRTEKEQKLQTLGDSLFAYAARGDMAKINSLLSGKTKADKQKLVNEKCVFDGEKTPLHFACLEGHVDVVAYLLANEADIFNTDVNQFTPAHYAVMQTNANTEQLLEILMTHMKLLNESVSLVHHVASYGRRMLGIAAFHGNAVATKWLLAHGAQIDAKEGPSSPQRTALHAASWRGYIEVVRILLDEGANAKALNANNETPLFEAILANQKAVVELFFDYGYWLNKKEREYLRPLATTKDEFSYLIPLLGIAFLPIKPDHSSGLKPQQAPAGNAAFFPAVSNGSSSAIAAAAVSSSLPIKQEAFSEAQIKDIEAHATELRQKGP